MDGLSDTASGAGAPSHMMTCQVDPSYNSAIHYSGVIGKRMFQDPHAQKDADGFSSIFNGRSLDTRVKGPGGDPGNPFEGQPLSYRGAAGYPSMKTQFSSKRCDQDAEARFFIGSQIYAPDKDTAAHRYQMTEGRFRGQAGRQSTLADLRQVDQGLRPVAGAPASGCVLDEVLHGKDFDHSAEARETYRQSMKGRAGKSPWNPRGGGFTRYHWADCDPREAEFIQLPRPVRHGSMMVKMMRETDFDSQLPEGERPAGRRKDRQREDCGRKQEQHMTNMKPTHISEVLPASKYQREAPITHKEHVAYLEGYGGAAGVHTNELGAKEIYDHYLNFWKPSQQGPRASDPVLY